MKKKIIITGGLGYIGTELCNIYAGEAWYHDIIVIDNKFFSASVDDIGVDGSGYINLEIGK